MITAAASLIVEVLIRHGIIKVQQAEVYQYGLEILISSLLTCCITVVCGLLFRCLAASIRAAVKIQSLQLLFIIIQGEG